MAIKRTDPRKLHDMPVAGNRLDDDILDALEPLDEDGERRGRAEGGRRTTNASGSLRRPPTYQPFADLRQRLRGH
ncbi:hypothetical protein [Sediminicurvatus halobius]|uniref:Uncharacterized protein n=1 Tax=Sediminicurvatus halobius TaxID=2182432 RepID=A0A2U2N819_9GAMM|nr:hypothetical protein [Spiribacter halobius]PWG65104.1 hypothetical protein DEM34_02150 [Spiribacter halobius]UEX78948.1 hypothetical protein LMH63_04710 [Spiribacter halobius]